MRRFAIIWVAILMLTGVVAYNARSTYLAHKHTNDSLRTFVCFFQNAVLTQPGETPQKAHQAIIFFQGVTNALKVPICPVISGRG